MTTDEITASAHSVPADWRAARSDREQKEIRFAEVYTAEFSHGTTGHNALLLIVKLAEHLDIAAGVKTPPAPPAEGDLVLTFGKYRDRPLSEVLRLDRGYVEWLEREGRDAEVRAAARALLIGPTVPMPLDDTPPPEEAPAGDGEIPF